MAICSMCRKDVKEMNGDVLENGFPICPECAKQFDTVLESNDSKQLRSAINYIYTCAQQASDDDIKNCLQDFLHENADVVDELIEEEEKKKRKEAGKKPVDLSEKEDYYQDQERETEEDESSITNPGIGSAFSAFAWIIWIGGIIAAIIVGSSARENGFLIFIGIAAGALVSGCFPMAVAYILRYLARIAYNTSEINRKLK